MKKLLSVLALTFVPSMALAQCGDTCFVGALGTGGAASDGSAQGFHLDAPSILFPGSTATISGNASSGHNTYSGTATGTFSGTIRGSTGFGRATGLFGDYNGQCTFGDPDCP